ncbi:probable glutathione S-transferase 5 isoform X2 [Exaiptasia diaphana]|uniref:glutathione transferase n=1 Tax=Exaiptasia diaphana TaxID=2652724 RepID=A0A913XB66_EXADI|nr:probable glutathione S-transferase 5 isoform X2 [Exaiptasia diaphana]
MPAYKLYYFNARGRAEPARLCFAAAGVKYEDVRYTFEEWSKEKAAGLSPMGFLPMLEVDGKKLNESLAIMRYLAREFGLCPKDSFMVAQCDMVVDSLFDVFGKLYAFKFEKDEEKKKNLEKEFYEKVVPNFYTKMTALLKNNSKGKGFFVGDKLTYADIMVFYCLDLVHIVKDLLGDHPELKAHFERVGNVPGIKKWVETRPKTDH